MPRAALQPLWLGALLLGLAGCPGRPPAPPRAPRGDEVSAETVVVNYGPARLRVLPNWQVDDRTPARAAARGRYVVMATEYPQLYATWRPLGVIDKAPPPGFLARAGDFAWLKERVVETAVGEGGGRQASVPAPGPLQLLIYDRDGKKAARQPLKLPAPCTAGRPALLQADEGRLYAALGCAEGGAYALVLDAEGALQRAAAVATRDAVDGYARWVEEGQAADEDYLLAGARLFQLRGGQVSAAVELPRSQPGAETRALLLDARAQEVVLVDGRAGLLQRFARERLAPRGELAFTGGPRIERLRAVLQGEKLVLVAAEREAKAGGSALFGQAFLLSARGATGSSPGGRVRIASDPRPVQSDHELVPGDAGGALLVWTHSGTTGPLVAMLRLNL